LTHDERSALLEAIPHGDRLRRDVVRALGLVEAPAARVLALGRGSVERDVEELDLEVTLLPVT
jgi:hypothetical protein